MFYKKLSLIAAVLGIAALTGCGWVKSPNSMYAQAKKVHGDCTVVSKSKTSDRSEVVLHDTLQDFNYEVVSSMNDINIDGSSFGSLPGTTDHFGSRLREKVISDTEKSIKEICESYGITYEFCKHESISLFLSIYPSNEETAQKAAVECAKVIQSENAAQRLDGLEICAYKSDRDVFGNVKLPNIIWRTKEDEKVEYYTKMARMQTDPNAVFVRSEKGIFADTGASLDGVVNALGSDIPTDASSPVTFYYFKASDGKEYYLCDFNYYDERGNIAWYTNYVK